MLCSFPFLFFFLWSLCFLWVIKDGTPVDVDKVVLSVDGEVVTVEGEIVEVGFEVDVLVVVDGVVEVGLTVVEPEEVELEIEVMDEETDVCGGVSVE